MYPKFKATAYESIAYIDDLLTPLERADIIGCAKNEAKHFIEVAKALYPNKPICVIEGNRCWQIAPAPLYQVSEKLNALEMRKQLKLRGNDIFGTMMVGDLRRHFTVHGGKIYIFIRPSVTNFITQAEANKLF